MRNLTKQFLSSGIILASFLLIGGCTSSESVTEKVTESVTENITEYVIDQSDFLEGAVLIEDIQESELSEEEVNGLLLMREEEKLARDVYNTLGEQWGTKIFSNIANSEQTHTDAVKVLLERYDIEDPVLDDTIGVFDSVELATLYEDLVKKGTTSLLDAFIVGAIVEDLDIKDLNELLLQTDNGDITRTYNNLNKGSRNHLRAYMRQIERNNGSYTPQYITQEEFDSILSTQQERGSMK